jgi:hypothetical protein
MFHYHNGRRLQCSVIKTAEAEEYVSTKPSLAYMQITFKCDLYMIFCRLLYFGKCNQDIPVI